MHRNPGLAGAPPDEIKPIASLRNERSRAMTHRLKRKPTLIDRRDTVDPVDLDGFGLPARQLFDSSRQLQQRLDIRSVQPDQRSVTRSGGKKLQSYEG